MIGSDQINQPAGVVAMTTLSRLQDHLQNGVRERAHGPVPCVHCADGLELSVQAGLFYSSTPKAETGPWTHVECYSDQGQRPWKFFRSICLT